MINLFPKPEKIEVIGSGKFKFNSIALGSNLLSAEVIEDFTKYCALETGNENIVFKTDDTLADEAYIIKTGEKIEISSSGMAGQLYALQTLKQIFTLTDSNIPTLYIYDEPRYKIRGFMLDVGRYFYSVSDVKLFIRKMAFHKLNFFHFHLTEDQGFRVQIDKYPLLTEIGSKRACTNFNNKPHGGYYTKQDIKEIVDYAHKFNIKVMPEFDIPGHCRAAIAAYNDLTCFPRDLPVATHWGVKHDVLCVGKEKTMQFVYDVLDELFEMFPDKYIHIGGDEVPKHRWNLCPNCQKRAKEVGAKNSDELQCWFMNTVKNYCKEHGRQVFMWSWDLEDSALLDEDLGFTLCGSDDKIGGRPFIDTSTKAYYIDLPYGYISLKDTADHKIQQGNCLGIETPLWCEYVADMKKADIMMFPRLAAACETAWLGKTSYAQISRKLDDYYKLLDKNNWGYAKPAMAVPNKLRGKFGGLWFEKRQLTWEGLHNIFDDKKIEKIARLNKN